MKSSEEIVIVGESDGLTESAEVTEAARERAKHYAGRSLSANTRRSYASDLRVFGRWCERAGRSPFPASSETMALYLASLADGTTDPEDPSPRRVSTIERQLAAISTAHRMAGLPSPVNDGVRAVLRGIRNEHGSPPYKKAAAVAETLRRMVPRPQNGDASWQHDIAVRDAAVLLVGFGGAFRRSELADLKVGDVVFEPEGLVITLRRSKTDQSGTGRVVRVARGSDPSFCPVLALKAWITAAAARGATDEGPLFRSLSRRNYLGPITGQTVARIVKDAAAAAGEDPARYAGHSLRSGHVTSAVRASKPLDVIRAQTGHKHLATLFEYIQRHGSWDEVSGRGLL